jgi:long-chain acyl-CoA synthetase
MAKRLHSKHDQGLQNAYGTWAAALPVDQIVAIALGDPRHAMAAFFACAKVGRVACMAMPDLDDRFTVLSNPLDPSNVETEAGKIAPFITFTSGSTNRPKAIVREASSWIYSFERNGVTTNDTVAVIGNLAHSLPHYAATEAMHIGAKVLFCPTRLRQNTTVVYATPTQLRLVKDVFETVRLILIGGGHFTAADRINCERQFPNADIRVFYGTAETSFIAIADKNTPEGSVGQAYDGVHISIVKGDVCVQTPMIANKNLGTETRFDPCNLYATGELGTMDDQGNLFLLGRADRRVTIGDKSIHLDAIEADLMAIDSITNAGVVALPDALRGMRAFACVQGHQIEHPLLGGVLLLDDWPTLLSGKTDYAKLTKILSQAFA